MSSSPARASQRVGRPAARLVTLAGLLAALAGCAVPPVRDGALPAVPVPAAWSEPAVDAAPAALARWWERFDDPQLTALVAQALEANASLRCATCRRPA